MAARQLRYCMEQVRKHDYKHYLCLLNLSHRPLRDAAFALRAFNLETAMAKESSHGKLELARLRLVWWRDAIDSLYNPVPAAAASSSSSSSTFDHPVVKALATVVKQRRLSKHWFSRILNARLKDMDMVSPPVTLSELESYAESTASALLYLTLEAADIRNTQADHAASHTGKACGLSLLLQATPFHSSNRTSYLPLEVTSKHGVSQEELYRGVYGEHVGDAVFDVASAAFAHLQKARELAGSLPKGAAPILLPAVPAEQYLRKLQECGFNPFDHRLQRGVAGAQPLWMLLKLKWYSLKGVY